MQNISVSRGRELFFYHAYFISLFFLVVRIHRIGRVFGLAVCVYSYSYGISVEADCGSEDSWRK